MKSWSITKETLNKSILSFPRRREPSQIKELDPRLRGDDVNQHIPNCFFILKQEIPLYFYWDLSFSINPDIGMRIKFNLILFKFLRG